MYILYIVHWLDNKVFNYDWCTVQTWRIFLQVWNFNPLQSTPPVTGCSDPSAAPLLEILSKVFKANAVKGRHRFSSNLCNWEKRLNSKFWFIPGGGEERRRKRHFLVPNYSWLQNPWLEGYRPQIPVLSVLCLQLNLLNSPPRTKFLSTPLMTPDAVWYNFDLLMMST